MKVAAIQCDVAWEDREANFRHLAPRIAEAAAAGADLVALPEMFSTGFSMHTERVSEPEGGPTEQFLREAAARHGIAVLGSAPVRPAGKDRPVNLGIVALPDAVLHYAKVHPFSFGGEAELYDAGERTLTFEVKGVSTTLVICYDLRFPELFAPLAARSDLFCVIASWPEARRDHWSTLLKARSIECLAYVLGVNRVGTGGGLTYVGDSVLWAPGGELCAAAGSSQEALILHDVDAARVASVRSTFPFLQDRRPAVYRRIAE